jgi:ApaG protein
MDVSRWATPNVGTSTSAARLTAPALVAGPAGTTYDSDYPIVSDTVTRGIRVQVRSVFIPERSSPREQHYFFAYHVRISNEGEQTAQLMSRHWVITNADGDVQEVRGPGVVGETPVLAPGASFEYTSYCPLTTAVGTMQGSYTMATPEGSTFDAQIAPFTLAMPNALN